jgi:hypothetical protein
LDILHRVGMQDCKLIQTTLVVDEKLLLINGDPLSAEDATSFHSIVIAL